MKLLLATAVLMTGLFAGVATAAAETGAPTNAGNRSVEVLGLFKNAALLRIGERQQMLRAGETSAEGVKLISASSQKAVIEIGGKRRELGVSGRIAGAFKVAEKKRVSLQRNLRNEYRTGIKVNGRSTEAIVDTGANLVAFSSVEAGRLGLRYEDGARAVVETASGVAEAWRISLSRVELSGIVINNVPAVVVKGAAPQTTLLGMSWLRHVSISEEAGVMYLQQRY